MLVRWDPYRGVRKRGDVFNEMNTIQQEMNRLFDDFFGERRPEMAEGAWLPAVDMLENETELIVKAEMPGMSQEDISLDLQENVLTMKGEKKKEQKEEKENYHRIERSYGTFSRSFTLPCNIKADDVKATFKDGILEVVLPKEEEVKSQKINIFTSE